MALIRPEQLRSGSYNITGSFTGSFVGDGSGLTGISGSTPFPYVGDAVITGSLTVSGSDSIVNFQEIQFNTDHSASGHTAGRMYWDDDNKTITVDMQGSDVRLQLGQEEHVYAKNNSGVTINNGDAVRLSGALGANVTIEKAVSKIKSFKDITEKDQILGLATEQIDDNQSGYVTTFGAVRDLDTSTFAEGDILYLSNTTSGSYTNIRPPAPYFEARVGIVEVANATEGVILVRPAEPIFLTDISQITSSGVIPNEKTYLCYDDSTDLINFTNEFSGSFSGSFQGDGSGLSGISASISLPVFDEGSQITAAVSNFNFVGNGITATAVGNNVTITVPGGTVPLFPFVGDAVITGSLEIVGTGEDLFLIKNQTNETILQVSQSGVVVLSTQSVELTTTAPNGGIYFTSASFFVGLD